MLKDVLLVGAGGFAGSVARYLISTLLISANLNNILPLSTFAVNATGSLIIGFLLAVTNGGGWHYLCVVGFCGGFTTFSAFSSEIFNMIKSNNYSMALIYIIISVLVCVLAVWFGMYLGSKFNLIK